MKANFLFPPRVSSSLMWLALLGAGCAKAPGQAPTTVEKPKVESDLGRTTLTRDAAKSLGIRSEPVRNGPV